jgi:hypothetical protein
MGAILFFFSCCCVSLRCSHGCHPLLVQVADTEPDNILGLTLWMGVFLRRNCLLWMDGWGKLGSLADFNNYKHISWSRPDSTMAFLPPGHWCYQFFSLC